MSMLARMLRIDGCSSPSSSCEPQGGGASGSGRSGHILNRIKVKRLKMERAGIKPPAGIQERKGK